MVGRALWDVFSDNHDVIAPDRREIHLGSFRAAGDFIADLLNDEVGSRQYGYMDFYMGTIWINDREGHQDSRAAGRRGTDWAALRALRKDFA